MRDLDRKNLVAAHVLVVLVTATLTSAAFEYHRRGGLKWKPAEPRHAPVVVEAESQAEPLEAMNEGDLQKLFGINDADGIIAENIRRERESEEEDRERQRRLVERHEELRRRVKANGGKLAGVRPLTPIRPRSQRHLR